MNNAFALHKSATVDMLLLPIQKYLDDPNVDEVTINQPKELWTKNFNGWTKHEIPELTLQHIQSLITAVCTYNSVKEASNLSLRMPKGERAQITTFPALIDGQISFNIRKHGERVFTLEELNEQGAFEDWKDTKLDGGISKIDKHLLELKESNKIMEFLQAAILNHKNIIIAGATGSGKTTFARALIKKVPTTERIITIEDVHELFLPEHPNKLHMMFGTGTGRITADEALTACMRLSPDRIFLAELRGNEAWEYLNSLNTGHSGSITTVHANSAAHTFERVATLIKKSDVGRMIDLETINLTLKTTLEVVLFFKRRKLVEIYFDPIGASKLKLT